MQNVSWTIMAKIVAMVLFFVTDIVIARILSVDDYGEWTYFYSIRTMLAYLCYFGIDQAAKIIIARISDEDEQRVCFQTALVIRIVINLLFIILVVLSSETIVQALNSNGKYPELCLLMKFGGILAAFNAFQEFFKGIGYGIKDNKTVLGLTIYEFGFNFLIVSLSVVVIKNVYGVLWGYIISGAITLFFSLYYLQKKHALLRAFRIKISDKQIVFNLLKYALPLLIANIANVVSLELDTIMIGTICSSEQVAMYNIGKKICTKAGQVNLALATGSMAAFAIINKENVKQKLGDLKRVSCINLTATLLISVFLVPFAIVGIPLLYGQQYVEAIPIMLWFIPFYFMYGISTFFAVFMDFRGKSTLRSLFGVISIVMNFILNYIFIPKYGAIGAVWTTLLTQCPYMIFVFTQALAIIRKIKRNYL